ILDDCHAADELSLQLIEFLARQVSEMRVLLIVTAREVEINQKQRSAEILANLSHDAHSIYLSGFDEGEVVQFLKEHQIRGDARVVSGIMNATEGNPFFLKELISILPRSTGSRRRGLAIGDFEIPRHVADVIDRRFNDLPEGTQEVLKIAAVIGGEFDVS